MRSRPNLCRKSNRPVVDRPPYVASSRIQASRPDFMPGIPILNKTESFSYNAINGSDICDRRSKLHRREIVAEMVALSAAAAARISSPEPTLRRSAAVSAIPSFTDIGEIFAVEFFDGKS
jgi:hypothetical protein